jgi:FAD/FMN-containing dehydrogenase
LVAPRHFRGEFVGPGDEHYERLRWMKDRRYDLRPAVIARCVGVADVRAAIAFARERGLEIAVRSGGHSFHGFSSTDGGVVIDLGLMRDVRVDLQRRTATIRPGATNGDILAETTPFGLAPITGGTSNVGFGGLAIFNGQGYLSGRYGNAVDQILSVDMVLADGRLITASAASHEDLFWAVRGAGDSFGVVVSFEAALFPVPDTIVFGSFSWGAGDAAGVLEQLGLLDPILSEDIDWLWILDAEDDGEPKLRLDFRHLGSADDVARDVAAIDAIQRRPIRRSLARRSYTDAHHEAGEVFDADRVYSAACDLAELDERTVSVLMDIGREHAAQPASLRRWRGLGSYPYSKGLARQPPTPAAFNRRQGHVFLAETWYDDPEQDAAHEEFLDGVVNRLVEAGVTIGGFNASPFNYSSRTSPEILRDSFGTDTYERLARLKSEYDPESLFSRSMPLVSA